MLNTGLSFAQDFKTSTQVFNTASINTIKLKLNEVYNLKIVSKDTDQIKLKTSSEGVYTDEIRLFTERQGKVFSIHSTFREILSSGFDKLSSNKGFSFSVELIIPKNLKVILYSNSASLQTSGSFSYLEAHLVLGNCGLLDFKGKGFIETIRGNIFVSAEKSTIKAKSNHGKVKIATGFSYGPILKLTSVEGNITVKHRF